MKDDLLTTFFTDPENGLVDIKPDASLFDSVRILIERDPGFKGKKLIARKELSYVYFWLKKDFNPSIIGKDREQLLRGKLNMPPKWEHDKVINDVIATFSYVPTTSEKLLLQARENLEDFMILFKEIRDFNRKLISILQKDISDPKLKAEALNARTEAIQEAKKYFKDLTTSVKDLKDSFNLISELEVQISVEEKKNSRDKVVSRLETDSALWNRSKY